MMKNKRIRFSISSKVWLAIMGTVAIVIGGIWTLQSLYLEEYYFTIKENEFQEIQEQIATSIKQEPVGGYSNSLYEIASNNTLCIDISDVYGRRIITYEGLNYNCHVHSDENHRIEFLNSVATNPGEIKFVRNDRTKRDYLIYSDVYQSSDNFKYIVVVSSSLAPVKEASITISNQLILVMSLMVVVATIISFAFSRYLTKPIVLISKGAIDIARGNLDVDVSLDSNDELSDLKDSFLYMQSELKKANLLQKELIANVSHDIRTPLTMIKGYAEAIRDITGENKEKRQEQLTVILEEVDRLNKLVSEVMDFSIIQAGHTIINSSSFDICDKVQTILKRFELFEDTIEVNFIFNTPLENIFVDADEDRIEQVLYNLICNALNHLGENKNIEVKIDIKYAEVIVSVIDTGVGIAKEDLPLIWDRYYKPYKNSNLKTRGTGLGLSIIKAILLNHNSRFGVTSSLGHGSEFWFTLKLFDNSDSGNNLT